MTAIPADVREGVLNRDMFACRRCGAPVNFAAYSLHHRQGRRGPNPHRYSNLITLCGTGSTGCHGHTHANPAESYNAGLMVRRHSLDDTEEVPVTDLNGTSVCLTDDGDLIPIYTTTRRAEEVR